jgi:hypothetical protein
MSRFKPFSYCKLSFIAVHSSFPSHLLLNIYSDECRLFWMLWPIIPAIHLTRSIRRRYLHRSLVRVCVFGRRWGLLVHLCHSRLRQVRRMRLVDWCLWLMARLVSVALVWVTGCCVGIGFARVLSPAPEEEGDETEEGETADYAAYNAADCAARKTTGRGG